MGLVLVLLLGPSRAAYSAEWQVAPGSSGKGSAAAPFGGIGEALGVARPGDVILVQPGTFTERLISVRSGTVERPITIRAAQGRGSVVVTASGRVLSVYHAYVHFDGFVFDGQFGKDDLIAVKSGADGFELTRSEARRIAGDAIDIGAVSDVLIDSTMIHDALDSTRGRTDAHGIAAGAVRRLTIRNTEIYAFSGDAIQVDAGRSGPGWDDVLIDGCRLWLGPLGSATAGFPQGAVPGENALDTKTNPAMPRGRLTIRNTEAFGFLNGLIQNMAAFNIKENVDVVMDGVTVHDSEIAFRLRAPAHVRIQNAVVYDTAYAVRYEDNIQEVKVFNSTFGSGVRAPFHAAASAASRPQVRNVLLLGPRLPLEATDPSNMAVAASSFVNAATHDYRLSPASPAVDAGVDLPAAPTDRDGAPRPQGVRTDIGAFERPAAATRRRVGR